MDMPLLKLLFAFFVIGLCVLIFNQKCWQWMVGFFPRRDTIKKSGSPTLFDVKRCIEQGDFSAAIRTYRKIFPQSTPQQAKEAVEQLAKSMRV